MVAIEEGIRSHSNTGGVWLGMTRLSLFWLLGRPDGFGGTSRKYPLPSIYQYGEVPFVFPNCRNRYDSETVGLVYVHIDDNDCGRDEPEWLLR